MTINAKTIKRAIFAVIGIIVVGAVLLIAFGGGSSEKKEIERLNNELKAAQSALSTNGTHTAQASPGVSRPQGATASSGSTATTPTTEVLLPAPAPQTEDKEEKLQALEVKARELRKDIEVIENRLEQWKANASTCRRVLRTDTNEYVQRQAQSDLKVCEKTVSKFSVLLKQKKKELGALYTQPTPEPTTTRPTPPPPSPRSIPTPAAPATNPRSPIGPGIV